jgi:hypothetical protein
MGPDGVWRRIRWDNVARLAALVALALLVVAWPRLGGRAPRLPPGTDVPLGGEPAGDAASRPTPKPTRPARKPTPASARRRGPVRRRPPAKRMARVRRTHTGPAPRAEARRPQTTTRPPPRSRPLAAQPSSPRADPAAAEFGLP